MFLENMVRGYIRKTNRILYHSQKQLKNKFAKEEESLGSVLYLQIHQKNMQLPPENEIRSERTNSTKPTLTSRSVKRKTKKPKTAKKFMFIAEHDENEGRMFCSFFYGALHQ